MIRFCRLTKCDLSKTGDLIRFCRFTKYDLSKTLEILSNFVALLKMVYHSLGPRPKPCRSSDFSHGNTRNKWVSSGFSVLSCFTVVPALAKQFKISQNHLKVE